MPRFGISTSLSSTSIVKTTPEECVVLESGRRKKRLPAVIGEKKMPTKEKENKKQFVFVAKSVCSLTVLEKDRDDVRDEDHLSPHTHTHTYEHTDGGACRKILLRWISEVIGLYRKTYGEPETQKALKTHKLNILPTEPLCTGC